MRHFSALRFPALAAFAALALTAFSTAGAVEAPKLVQKDGRHALMVEGKPYFVLGGQVHNSSAWPGELAQVWQSAAEMHANTVAAPVYWEQFEPVEGKFDFGNVDALVLGARAHNLHVTLLWFGTWKNGNNHYVPGWVKTDTKRFPRTIRPDGEPIDVMSPLGLQTLAADKKAFVELMRHVREIDGAEHTVILVQVENESGNVGSVRDNSAEANKLIAGAVPADLLAALKKPAGTWSQVFGSEADETFQAYYQAKYMGEIAAAGKKELNIPFYMNVWIDYPSAQLPQRQADLPGIAYPSGGAVRKMIGLWKALAPALDAIGPDIYTDDADLVKAELKAYNRPDNPLWIPEVARADAFGPMLFYAIGQGAIGFTPFGFDKAGWNIQGDQSWQSHKQNFALVEPISGLLAQAEFDGKVKTAVEEPARTSQELDFGPWQATVAFGFPQPDGGHAPGTKDQHGAAIVVQLGPDEFLVTGVDASVTFHLAGKQAWIRSEVLSAEQGTYENGVWKPLRLWNGDETDRGLWFYQHKPEYVRIKLNRF